MTVPSPCNKICAIDPPSGLCSGCRRTLDEIARWGAMSDDEKRAVLAVGSRAVWMESDWINALHARLPQALRARIELVADWQPPAVVFDAVLHHGDGDHLRTVCRQVAARPGAIVGVSGLGRGETAVPLERLVMERSLSVNTAAAGGNASLMTIG